ncbi:MAG: dTDP-glucose 4,6-dehydratase [Magnetococcales bacterium]|nr:dTDP-glucose 4,6-dehydratase [Magnetococcales bacterium]
MTTILVCGGAGFIGSQMVRHLLDETGGRVAVVDRLTYAGSRDNLVEVMDSPRLAFYPEDITDRPAMTAIFARERPRWVVNFAAETHVDRSIDDASPFIHANVTGVQTLLDASLTHWRTLPEEEREAFRFLQISTDEVYGALGESGEFRESDPLAPNSPYAASKAAGDLLARAWRQTHGLPTLVTRCSNNYGPRQFPEKLIPLMLLNAREGRPLPVYGDGGNVRDWIHVADHCAALLQVLERGQPGEIYNIGGNCEHTNLHLVQSLCAILQELLPAGENPRLREQGLDDYRSLIRFVPDRPGHDRRYAVNSDKLQQALGWRPRVPLAEGLAQTVRWYLENEAWRLAAESRYRRERLGLAM